MHDVSRRSNDRTVSEVIRLDHCGREWSCWIEPCIQVSNGQHDRPSLQWKQISDRGDCGCLKFHFCRYIFQSGGFPAQNLVFLCVCSRFSVPPYVQPPIRFALWRYPAVTIACLGLGCVHIDTRASPSTRTWLPRNTSLHVFQWRPFTLIRVLYVLYGLLWISLVRAVSVQVVFPSNSYEVNNTLFVLVWGIRAMTHIWRQIICHCWIVHYWGVCG